VTRTRRSFTDDFKREAVKLCKQLGATATHIALDTSIRPACSDGGSRRSVAECWTSDQTGCFAGDRALPWGSELFGSGSEVGRRGLPSASAAVGRRRSLAGWGESARASVARQG
jgi:hypothetical protein